MQVYASYREIYAQMCPYMLMCVKYLQMKAHTAPIVENIAQLYVQAPTIENIQA